MERISLSTASTSMAQTRMGQNEFLFRTPTSQAKEPETLNFSQEVEGEREVSHSQPWSTPFEHTLLGVHSFNITDPTFEKEMISELIAYGEEDDTANDENDESSPEF